MSQFDDGSAPKALPRDVPAAAVAALAQLPDPVLLVVPEAPEDSDLEAVWGNEAAAAALATDAGDLVGMQLGRRIPADCAAALAAAATGAAKAGASRTSSRLPPPWPGQPDSPVDVVAWPVGGYVAVSWRASAAPAGSPTLVQPSRPAVAESGPETERAEQQQLDEVMDRLQLVLDSSQLGIWDWNIQTGETVFNERWAQIVGYTLAELEPVSIDTWVNLANPEDLAASNDLIAAHAAGETEFYDLACRMRHKDGHWVWVRDRGQIVERDDEGKPLRMTGTHEDITPLKAAGAALATSEAALKLLLEAMIEGVVIQDVNGMIVSCNPAAERILGLTLDQMTGRTSTDPRWRSLHEDGSDFPGEDHPAMVTLRTGKPMRDVLMGVHKPEGTLSWILINSQVIPSLEDPAEVGGALTTFVDITRARESHRQLQELASRDPLTDLVNRRGLYERIEAAAQQSGPDTDLLGILFIDLDGLKEANDSHGHLVGDEVIVQSARRILNSVRRDDVVARFGGDEFVVLLPSIRQAGDAERVASVILDAVAQPIEVGGAEVRITCSIGVTILRDGDAPEDALGRADTATYRAKHAGRGRIVVFDSDD